MRYTIVRWPVWLRGVLTGGVYAGIWVLTSSVVLRYGWVLAVLGGLIGGVIFGIVMTLTMARAEKALNPVDGPALTPDERAQAIRAADRGQRSDDSRVQAAAVALARQRVRQRIGIVLLSVLVGFLALVAAAFAVVANPRWWLLAAMAVVAGPLCIFGLSRQLKGATTLLAAAEGSASGVGQTSRGPRTLPGPVPVRNVSPDPSGDDLAS